ncbi:hypothetical protein GY45DRAFT_1331335 [Cubamyces sp. BRFM 1775]|nr:hypothetical protein GY45DRAFT_1331335 [Cubamyces sp. BRFM 1775]
MLFLSCLFLKFSFVSFRFAWLSSFALSSSLSSLHVHLPFSPRSTATAQGTRQTQGPGSVAQLRPPLDHPPTKHGLPVDRAAHVRHPRPTSPTLTMTVAPLRPIVSADPCSTDAPAPDGRFDVGDGAAKYFLARRELELVLAHPWGRHGRRIDLDVRGRTSALRARPR